MAFSEVSSLDADVTVALGKTDKKTGKPYPKQAEGYYLGKREVESKRGASFLHFLQTSKGNLGVWGTMDLNRKLSQVVPGTMVRITSTGTKATPNGEMYTYKVESDKTNTIEVAADESSAPSYSDTSDEIDGNTYSHEEEDAEAYSAPAAALTASRKADVEALLKRKSK